MSKTYKNVERELEYHIIQRILLQCSNIADLRSTRTRRYTYNNCKDTAKCIVLPLYFLHKSKFFSPFCVPPCLFVFRFFCVTLFLLPNSCYILIAYFQTYNFKNKNIIITFDQYTVLHWLMCRAMTDVYKRQVFITAEAKQTMPIHCFDTKEEGRDTLTSVFFEKFT